MVCAICVIQVQISRVYPLSASKRLPDGKGQPGHVFLDHVVRCPGFHAGNRSVFISGAGQKDKRQQRVSLPSEFQGLQAIKRLQSVIGNNHFGPKHLQRLEKGCFGFHPARGESKPLAAQLLLRQLHVHWQILHKQNTQQHVVVFYCSSHPQRFFQHFLPFTGLNCFSRAGLMYSML